jgi:hypothetical protein
MKTFSFPHLPPLRDFQFLTYSSGFVLTQTGQLYRFTGQQAELVLTPAAFTISHFHFLDQTHGAVIGAARPSPPPLQKSTVSAVSLPLLLVLWLVWRTDQRAKRARQLLLGMGGLLLGGSWLLAQSGTGELWVTLADRKPHLSHGTLDYVALPTKKLLRFRNGRWQASSLAPAISCQQVAFVAATARGYVLTAQGEVLETRTNGDTWQRLPERGVQLLRPGQQAITWLKEGNQLVYYQPPTRE